MKKLLIILISYLIGSFSAAYVLGKSKNIDIRNHGSGNAGSTNVLRVMGKKFALITFILDSLKGVVAVYLGYKIMGTMGSYIAAVFVVIGHNYPIFLKFKGGKGVATSLGILYALQPSLGALVTIVGITVIYFSKIVSLGSMLGGISAPIILNIFYKPNKYLNFTIIILALFIVLRHKDNIDRLIKGKENKLKL